MVEATAQTFAFKMLHRLQQEFGQRICHSYVISMSHTASDLLEVMLLAKEIAWWTRRPARHRYWWCPCLKRWRICNGLRP